MDVIRFFSYLNNQCLEEYAIRAKDVLNSENAMSFRLIHNVYVHF